MELVQNQNQRVNKDLYNEQQKKKKEAKREEIKAKKYYGNSKEYMKEWRLQNKRSPSTFPKVESKGEGVVGGRSPLHYISPSSNSSSSSAINPTPS